MKKIKKHAFLITIAVVSVVTNFIFFGHPNETVFDEVHFGKFITGYFTHEYYFDIHPPLGKLLISGAGYLTGFKPGFSFAQIGDKFPDKEYIWLRLLPNIAGTLLPIIIFFLALRIGLSQRAAFATGILIALENSIMSQSRLILLDSFLWLFGFSSLLSYLHFKLRRKIKYLYLAGIFGALALSIKWNGATFLAMVIILEIIEIFKNKKITLKKLKPKLLTLIAVPFFIYFIIFAIHLGLLTKSGPGDAFMTPSFQKTLNGSLHAKDNSMNRPNLFQKFIELNAQMYKSNVTLTASHPYSSKWYTWPFMARPIYYWHQAGITANYASRIYFLGNPIIWWTSTIAVIYALTLIIGYRLKLNSDSIYHNSKFYFLMGGFLFNLLPFLGIGRVMFLYHYTVALIFAVLIMCHVIDKLKEKKKIFTVLIALSLISFIYFAPLTYGLPLSESGYNMRVWLSSWK